MRSLLVTVLAAALAGLLPSGAGAAPVIAGCPVFPASNPWNRPIDTRPVDPRSAAIVAGQMAGAKLHLDLGTTEAEYGIPFTVVPRRQPLVPLSFGVGGEDYRDESDRGPVPIPLNAPVEGAGQPGDRHVIVIQRGVCRLIELYHAVRSGNGWRASAAARWSLRSNRLRPAGWTSADAAGLPIFPGLLRYEEAASGRIEHALRFTLPEARYAYTTPARHCGPAGNTSPRLPVYGMRFRLRASFSERPYHGPALAIVRAMKRYGLVFADQGSALYVTGVTDRCWAPVLDDFRAHPVGGSQFDVVRPFGATTLCR